jgi:TRAP-type C4-dicarboxylate transport system substrate-binding protein
MSKVTWDKLSKDDQALVKKSARSAAGPASLWDKSVADYTGQAQGRWHRVCQWWTKTIF